MCWALFESCPVCLLGNIMSGTVAIIPVKASSAGVEYSNPLFAPKHNGRKDTNVFADKYTLPESSTRFLLERHKPIAIAVFAVSCAVLFLALPIIVLLVPIAPLSNPFLYLERGDMFGTVFQRTLS